MWRTAICIKHWREISEYIFLLMFESVILRIHFFATQQSSQAVNNSEKTLIKCIKVPGDDGGIITSGGGSTSTTGGN